ncbi:MAG: Rne/Rng family ribonuclease [Chthoniobacteraceae bacterium]
MTERVKRMIGLAPRQTGNKIIINCEKLEKRVALLENGVLEEYTIERPSDRNIVGSIYKGRVKNIEHGLKAMFVDIGYEKNAFLHFWDALPSALDSGIEEVERKDKKAAKKISSKDIPDIYPVGSEVLVQVTKGPISTKGPRITTNISLAGRFLVLMPYSEQSGISRKIESPKERDRLRKILRDLNVPEGIGVIIRTVGEGQKARDLAYLLEQWRSIEEAMKKPDKVACVFQEPDLIERTVRDFLTDEIDEILCDDEAAAKRMMDICGQISKRSRSKIKHYTEPQPIFEKYGIKKQIDDSFHRQVWLPCGGYIVIDETEALVAIDVNTGRNKGSKDLDKTILQTNLEAADEMSRQMRLRNIGGIIIGDFIDMKGRRDQQQVYQRMKERMRRDKAKTHILPISALGLMEMTRQRAAESLHATVYEPCPYCGGRGRIKSSMSMSVELQRALHQLLRSNPEVHEVKVIVHPHLLNRLKTEDDELLVEIERRYEGRLSFRSDPTLHHEKFTVLNALTNQELK